MKRCLATIAAMALFLAFAATTTLAQSLLDNEFYKKALDLRAQSDQALQAGDYDKAAELAAQAADSLKQSDAYVARMTSFYRANGWLSRASDAIAHAKSIKADVDDKAAYDKAVADAKSAKDALDGEQYDRSIELSKGIVASLEGIQPKTTTVAVTKPETPPPPAESPPVASANPLPQKYVVRLITTLRDCLWRIAGYPFIYGDPLKWRVLYDANRNVLQNPDNPDLIQPGQVLIIPSIAGETREGVYDPQTDYEAFLAH